jgi:hypothetical protein
MLPKDRRISIGHCSALRTNDDRARTIYGSAASFSLGEAKIDQEDGVIGKLQQISLLIPFNV